MVWGGGGTLLDGKLLKSGGSDSSKSFLIRRPSLTEASPEANP